VRLVGYLKRIFGCVGPVAQKVTISFYSAHSTVKQCSHFVKASSASSLKLTDILITPYVRTWVCSGPVLNGSEWKRVSTVATLWRPSVLYSIELFKSNNIVIWTVHMTCNLRTNLTSRQSQLCERILLSH